MNDIIIDKVPYCDLRINKMIIKMIKPTFEISVNGEKVSSAKVQSDLGVLSAIVTWVKRSDGSEELDLSLTGLDSVASKFLNWPKHNLKMGDSITISIADGNDITEPTEMKTPSELESMLRTYHYLKEKLKDHLT